MYVVTLITLGVDTLVGGFCHKCVDFSEAVEFY